MKYHFVVKDVLQEERKVGILLSHIPSEYYDSLVTFSAPVPVCALRLAERCSLENKAHPIKFKLFVEASKEPFFYDK